MKLLSKGMWLLRSKTDSRWDCDGEAEAGGFIMPSECEKRIEKLEQLYGKKPDDLTWRYEKY